VISNRYHFTLAGASRDWRPPPPFTLVARSVARNHAKHAICSYLINRATHATFAHAGLFWSNS